MEVIERAVAFPNGFGRLDAQVRVDCCVVYSIHH